MLGMLTSCREVETDRQKFANSFVRSMYKKPQSEAYLPSIIKASLQTPSNTAFALIAGFLVRADMSSAMSKVDKPVLVTVTARGQSRFRRPDQETHSHRPNRDFRGRGPCLVR